MYLTVMAVDSTSLVGRVTMGISWKRSLKFGRGSISFSETRRQNSKWVEVQMMERTYGVEETDKSTFQQVDLPHLISYGGLD